ncbi:MAG: diguanylate cyclase [Chitinispirillales bacterium]|jgi:diguanylate cyclase (GGDEF)-like protein|nr:diguanylate cyclase [Chitinispirillales bacterium]
MLAILNYILLIAIAAASAAGVVNGLGDDYDDFGGYTGLLFPLLAFGAVFWLSLRPSKKRLGAHVFLWPVAAALLSRTLFASSGELQGVYPVMLTVAAVLPALVRAEPVWGAVFAFSAVFYTGQVAMERKAELLGPAAVDISSFLPQLEFLAMSFFAGFIPWLILRKRAGAQEREFNATLEEVRNNALTDAMARTRELSGKDAPKKNGGHSGAMSRGSGSFMLDSGAANDTISLLNVGGEGVNVQLKSMLFFMRYNFKALTAGVFIYDPLTRMLVLNCYDTKGGVQIVENAQIPFGGGVIGSVASDNKLFMSGDVSLYQGGELPYYSQSGGVCSILAAPIVADGSKELLGVLAVDSINKNAFTDHDKELMRRFAIIAGALIVNIRMSVSLEQAAKMFKALAELSHEFSIALKLDDIFRVLIDMVPKIIPACSRTIVVLHDPAKNSLRLQYIGGAVGELTEGMEFPPGSGGVYSYAFNNNCPAVVSDFQAKKTYRFIPDEQQNPMIRSLLVLPIVGGEDRRCVGLFSAESAAPGLFKSDLEQTLNTIVENASVAAARSVLYMKMEKLATTDGLTGLNNHRTFQEIASREFERAKRYGRPLSMLLTDIDHFKSFNDTYGHPVGDLVLREIAGCIRSAVRVNDFPARYGGEEFAVVLPETAEQGAMVIAERIRQTVEARVIESGQNMLRVTISIGCVTFPTYGTTQQEIIDCADKALYASKKGGRNRATLYNPSMTVASK